MSPFVTGFFALAHPCWSRCQCEPFLSRHSPVTTSQSHSYIISVQVSPPTPDYLKQNARYIILSRNIFILPLKYSDLKMIILVLNLIDSNSWPLVICELSSLRHPVPISSYAPFLFRPILLPSPQATLICFLPL